MSVRMSMCMHVRQNRGCDALLYDLVSWHFMKSSLVRERVMWGKPGQKAAVCFATQGAARVL